MNNYNHVIKINNSMPKREKKNATGSKIVNSKYCIKIIYVLRKVNIVT